MRRALYIMLLGAAAVWMTSCSTDTVYSQFRSIPSEKWHMDSAVSFDYPVSDTAVDYRLIVNIRHTECYPYQNMWLFIEDSLRNDTIEFYLANDRGQWLGDKHHGFIDMPVLLDDHRVYPDSGTYHLTIRHGMRDSVLRGVADIGIEVIRN